MTREIAFHQHDSLGCQRFCGQPMDECHSHTSLELNVVCGGTMTFLWRDGMRTVRPGMLSVFWGAFPHQCVEVDGDPVCYSVHVPTATFLQWDLPGSLTTALLAGEWLKDHDPTNASIDGILFPQWNDRLEVPVQAADERIVLLEIEARLRKLSRSIESADAPCKPGGCGSPSRNPSELAPVQRMTSYVAERYADELSADEVAAASGLHPKYAMTLFKKTLGISILGLINQHRLAHAQRLLATSDRKVADIAFEAGFGSVSRLYEVFQESVGKSPAEYRKELTRR